LWRLLLLGWRKNETDQCGFRTAGVTLDRILVAYFMVLVSSFHMYSCQIKMLLGSLLINLWPSVVLPFFLFEKSAEEATVSQRFVSDGQGQPS
jgi:hypothetical protein